MSWLRIDDGFVDHPKLAGWAPSERWRWLELLSWCSRHRTNGLCTSFAPIGVRAVRTSAFLARAVDSGLIDAVGDELYVHDWSLYNGDLAARVAAYCEKYPQASANDVHRFAGGNRQVVLQLVREYRAGGSASGSAGTEIAVDKQPPSLSQRGSSSGSKGGSGPQPLKDQEPSVSPSVAERRRARAHEAETDGLTDLSSNIAEARRALGLDGEDEP